MYFYYAEQKQKDLEGYAVDEVSLVSCYQSELVVLWEANTAAMQQLKTVSIGALCIALLGMILSTFSTLCPSSKLSGLP